ncbi:MAG: type II secretion system protein GspM [Comamonas sp.]
MKRATQSNRNASATTTLLRQRWQALAPRERRLVSIAALLVVLAVLWWLLLAPAIATLRGAPAEHQRLDQQLAEMQALETQARQLQGGTRLSATQALQQVESSLAQQLGKSATLARQGDRITVTLTNAAAAPLQQWLAQVRANAHAVPLDMRITRGTASAGKADAKADAAAPSHWSGSIVFSLPAP